MFGEADQREGDDLPLVLEEHEHDVVHVQAVGRRPLLRLRLVLKVHECVRCRVSVQVGVEGASHPAVGDQRKTTEQLASQSIADSGSSMNWDPGAVLWFKSTVRKW